MITTRAIPIKSSWGRVVGLAFADKNGCRRLGMGVTGKNRWGLCNETLLTWENLIATPNYRRA